MKGGLCLEQMHVIQQSINIAAGNGTDVSNDENVYSGGSSGNHWVNKMMDVMTMMDVMVTMARA